MRVCAVIDEDQLCVDNNLINYDRTMTTTPVLIRLVSNAVAVANHAGILANI